MATNTESKNNEESSTPATSTADTTPTADTEPAAQTTSDAATTATNPEATAAQNAAAAAYYQQYGYQYGYYPYNYGYAYNGYNNGYDANNTAAYQQYYQQYQQQLLASQTNTNAATSAITPNGAQINANTGTESTETKANEDNNIHTNNNGDNANDDKNTDTSANGIKPNKDLKEWTHVEVAAWVQSVNNGAFTEHAQSFIDNEINGNVLYDMSPQQLQLGLYMNNMVKRLEFHNLIQTLKRHENAMNENGIKPISELQRAPPVKKRKKNKKKNKKKHDDTAMDVNDGVHNNITATATFLKLGTQHAMLHNKSSSQMLVDKMAMNNKRKIKELDLGGMQHKIEWKYKENKKHNDLVIELKDSVLFEWEYTRNIWQFANKQAYEECNFNTNVAEEMCGSDRERFQWKPKKVGMHYFGCQVANCASAGNMRIKVNVVPNQENPNKKQKC